MIAAALIDILEFSTACNGKNTKIHVLGIPQGFFIKLYKAIAIGQTGYRVFGCIFCHLLRGLEQFDLTFVMKVSHFEQG